MAFEAVAMYDLGFKVSLQYLVSLNKIFLVS